MNRLAALAALILIICEGSVAAQPPDMPLVLDDLPEIGRPGGELRTLVGRARDTRLLFAFGHARLIGYDLDLRLRPDILAGYEVEKGRVFTFHIRPGHRWSDGEPFTSEDFRFWWEDVANNETLQPIGPEIQLLPGGEAPKVEILDELTVRYSWSRPNPLFLPAIAGTSALVIYRPAHYLKQFHQRYADPDKLAALVRETNSRDWVQLFLRKDRLQEMDNPDMPTLQPWHPTTAPPAQRFIAERNQYYHRVDTTGQQLPYLDRFILEVADPKLVPIKTGAGETDLQFRHLSFKDYTFLKDSEKRSGLPPRLWPEGRGAHLAIYPNFNANDQVWRALFRDRRFREALSMGIDRELLSQFLYVGLAKPSNNSILPASPLYREEYGQRCIAYDPESANRALDELGLERRDARGIRLLPDGRPMELVVETPGEEPEQVDALELVRDQWREIGFQIYAKPSDRETLRNRLFAGETLMSIFYGIDNGTPTASMPPRDFAPTSQADQPQWPKWGQYYETKGVAGEPPDLVETKRLLDLFEDWQDTYEPERQAEIWHDMLDLYTSQCFTIGLVQQVPQPLAVRRTLRNLPKEAIFNWEPQGQIGLYRPDTFFYTQ